MKNEETAKRLKTAMERKKITAKELSDKSGVSEPSISQYVHGTFAPKNITAGKLADALDVDPMWLMGFDVPMETNEPKLTGYGNSDFEDETERIIQRLMEYIQLLNESGIEKLKERAEELTEMKKYRKEPEESNPAKELKYMCKECGEELELNGKKVPDAALS